jgi:hypothetical protein
MLGDAALGTLQDKDGDRGESWGGGLQNANCKMQNESVAAAHAADPFDLSGTQSPEMLGAGGAGAGRRG